MKSMELLEKTTTHIEHDNIIGTKWVGWSEFVGSRMMVEFVDKTNCIYTSEPRKYPMTYSVIDGKIFLSHIKHPFELKGQVLFNNGLPTFEKVA